MLIEYIRRHLPPLPAPLRTKLELPPREQGRVLWFVLLLLRSVPPLLLAAFIFSFWWDVPIGDRTYFGITYRFENLLRIISVSGLIGYLTNWLAITMLFHPRRRRPLLGQGLIPAQRERVIYRLAKTVSEELINEEIIKEKIEASGLLRKYREMAFAVTRNIIEDPEFRRELKTFASRYLNESLSSPEVRDRIVTFVEDKLRLLAGGGVAGLALRSWRFWNRDDFRQRLEEIHDRLGSIRPIVEQTVEREISDVLVGEGFSSRIGAILPPVDTVLSHSPALLVTSPRDRIFRLENTLLRHGIRPDDREVLEQLTLEERDLSAIVVNTGGIGTFPSVVSSGSSLHHALTTVAHEWLHNWFFFHPLGQHFWDSADMTTLNETAATLGGWEIGDRAYEAMTGIRYDRKPPSPPAERDPNAFDFNTHMRETRQQTEELLSQGRIAEAESYMEERRQELLERGYRIRKINQAYFAFYGSYATSAASVSPIEGQLRGLRQRSETLGEFLNTVAQFSTYEEFLEHIGH